MLRKRKAQSILEYVIVLSAIIAAVIAAANGPIKKAVTDMFQDSSDLISDKTQDFYSKAAQ